jgi:hypothetical protein
MILIPIVVLKYTLGMSGTGILGLWLWHRVVLGPVERRVGERS